MTKLKPIFLLISLGLAFGMASTWRQSTANSALTIETEPSKSQSANSNTSKNQNESSRRVFETSRDELERAIPSTVRRRMQCSIEENVAVKPALGGATPLTVSFDASASIAPCGKIVKWIWDFGDGTSGKGSRAKHTYKKPGEYIVNLNLADNKGNTNYVQLDYVVVVSARDPVQLKVKSDRHVSPRKPSKSARKN